MDLFNRIIVILLILTAMILFPALLLFPEQAVLILRYAADIIQVNVDWLQRLAPEAQIGMRLIFAATGLIIFIVGGVFLAVEVVRIRRNIVKLKDGSGELMLNGIEGLLAYHIDLLPDVLLAKPSVQNTGQGIRLSIYVETAPGINIPEKAERVREKACEIIQDQLGLQLKGEIRIVIKPTPYSRKKDSKQSRRTLENKDQPNENAQSLSPEQDEQAQDKADDVP